MTKIKFSCPGCNTKLKVPENLAGVAGPCPKCGGTIVAPLQSEEEPVKSVAVPQETKAAAAKSAPQVSVQIHQPSPAAKAAAAAEIPPPLESEPVPPQPPVIRQPVQPAPVAAPQPAVQKPVTPPPIIQQPVVQQPVQPRATIQPPFIQQPVHQTPVRSNQVGFPRPLEQVSQTAKFALANSPANYHQQGQASPTYPPRPAGESQAPQPHSRAVHNFSSPPPRPADPGDLIPEDIFEEQPEHAHASANAKQSGYGDAYGPRTQPIVVKKRQEAQISANAGKAQGMPRLDVSLGESGNGSLSTGQAVSRSGPTVIQLPEVGSERSDNFSINRPEPVAESRGYRAPNPVALTPPGGHPHTHFEEEPQHEEVAPVFEEVEPDYSYQVQPEFPIEDPEVDYQYMDDSDLPDSGEGSVAAFLAEAMDSSHEASRDAMSGKTKDEILDELLGVVPKSRKRKKGLSASTKFMLSVLAAVAVCAGIGVYYAIDKLGGFSMAGENVFGEEGLKNLKGKDVLKKYTVPDTGESDNVSALEVDPDAVAIPAPPAQGSAPPDKIDIDKLVQGVVGSGELEAGMAARIGLDPKSDKALPKEAKIEASVPPVAPNVPVITPITPAPSPLPPLVKDNYNPPPSFAAPGPDDPPLKNTHDLVDAFMRAPNWQARIPYTFQGESLRPAIESYYQTWPDFTLDRFKMKLFQMELEKEFGGPFWVYQITKSDADPGGVPMILRVENGNLKVDWQVFSEFSDQHFVKFREGKISDPHTFRLVAERVSEYPGADRPGFTDINDYLCFELNPPYGGYRAFSEYAFVKKGTEVAKKMDEKIALGDDPLAVILSIDRQNFKHGIRHYVIKEFVDEGWFN